MHEQPKNLIEQTGNTVLDIPEGHMCCGSAGTYNILHQKMAKSLLKNKVENIEKIMARQLDDKQRLDCADDIVINNNNRANLTDQLDQLHKKYLDLTHQASHNPTYV